MTNTVGVTTASSISRAAAYAKVINLSPTAEPEIYATTRRFGTVLENVIMDPNSRKVDLDDGSLTLNTRARLSHRLSAEQCSFR